MLFLPFYARMLGVEGLGIYGLILSISAIISIFFSFNLHSGLVVYTSPLKKVEQIRRNFSTVFNFVILLSLVGSTGAMVISFVFLPNEIHLIMPVALVFTFSATSVIFTIVFPKMFQHTKLVAVATLITEYVGAAAALLLVMLSAWTGIQVMSPVTADTGGYDTSGHRWFGTPVWQRCPGGWPGAR